MLALIVPLLPVQTLLKAFEEPLIIISFWASLPG